MEAGGNATLSSQLDHSVHHVARACHTEAYIVGAMKHHVGSLDEVLRTFLHGDTTQEGDHLLLASMVRTRNGLILFRQRINGVVHGEALTRILMVLVNDGLTCQLRHTHDTVGIVHTVLLDAIDGGVHLAARTVEVGGMHVDAQGFAADLLSVDACRESQPVVSVDDIELFRSCHHACNDRVVVDLLVQIAGIASCKLHAAEVVDVHIVEVGIDMLTTLIVVFGVHDVAHTLLHIVIVDVAPGNGHGVHGHNATGMLTLITKGMRQTEHGVDVALSLQTFRDTVVSSSKSTKHMRRILPSKH